MFEPRRIGDDLDSRRNCRLLFHAMYCKAAAEALVSLVRNANDLDDNYFPEDARTYIGELDELVSDRLRHISIKRVESFSERDAYNIVMPLGISDTFDWYAADGDPPIGYINVCGHASARGVPYFNRIVQPLCGIRYATPAMPGTILPPDSLNFERKVD